MIRIGKIIDFLFFIFYFFIFNSVKIYIYVSNNLIDSNNIIINFFNAFRYFLKKKNNWILNLNKSYKVLEYLYNFLEMK